MLPLAPSSARAQRRGIGSRATIPSRYGRRLQADSPGPQWCSDRSRRVSTGLSLAALIGSLRSADQRRRSSTFLRPFAPRPLRRFHATMDALTPEGPALRRACLNTDRTPPRSHGLIYSTFRPFRRQPPDAPAHRFDTLPLSVDGFPSRWGRVWVSPFPSRLTATPGRIAFVILRTGRSPPVAPHPASRRRSYVRLQTGERLSGEDLHLSDRVNLPSH